MVINHNMASAFAQRYEGINSTNVQKSMEKLSSGEKINRAGDDSAGLAVSEKMRSQIRGLNQASSNTANAVNFIQTTESYLTETTDILQRIRELAVQGSNGIYSDEDRMQIQVEVSQLVAEVDRIASSAQFNGYNMLTGRFAAGSAETMVFHIGANVDQNIKINIGDMSATALGLRNAQGAENMVSVASADEANMTISTVDEALKNVNKQRADLGAVQNRLEMAQKGINVAAENLQASESRIRDADMAEELVKFTKNSILQQASTAMLAQANSQTASIMTLLKG